MTDDGDKVSLDLGGEWKVTSDPIIDGLTTYEGVSDNTVKLLINALNVEDTTL